MLYKDYHEYIDELVSFVNNHIYSNFEPSSSKKKYEQIEEKLKNSNNSSSFPLISLKNSFNLTEFEFFLLILSLFYIKSKALFVAKKLEIPSTAFARKVFLGNPLDSGQNIGNEFKYCFFNDNGDNFNFNLDLNAKTASFLLAPTKEFVQSDFLSLFKTIDLNNNTCENILKLYTKAYDKTLINIYGTNNSGKLDNVCQSMYGLKENILLINPMPLSILPESELFYSLFEVLKNCKIFNAVPVITLKNTINPAFNKNIHLILHFLLDNFKKIFYFTDQISLNQDFFPENTKLLYLKVPKFTILEQISLWKKLLSNFDLSADANIDKLVKIYDFDSDLISVAVSSLPQNEVITYKTLVNACNFAQSSTLDNTNHLIRCARTWNDIVLSHLQIRMLKNACDFFMLKHKNRLGWHFDNMPENGKMACILLSGIDNSGKHMTAKVLANEMGLPMYVLDIKKCISSDFDETIKRFNSIFDDCEENNTIIFIEHIEMLFEDDDRQEFLFLVLKLGIFKGILLLSTNDIYKIIPSFRNRVKFIANFTLPSDIQRLDIWKTIYLDGCPLSNDIDFEFLAENFEISGGTIKQIASMSIESSNENDICMENILNCANSLSLKPLCDTQRYAHIFEVDLELENIQPTI